MSRDQTDNVEKMALYAVKDIRRWSDRLKDESDDEEVVNAARNLRLVAGLLEHSVRDTPSGRSGGWESSPTLQCEECWKEFSQSVSENCPRCGSEETRQL